MRKKIINLFSFGFKSQLSIIFSALIILSSGSACFFIIKNQKNVIKNNYGSAGRQVAESIAHKVTEELSSSPVDDTALAAVIAGVLSSGEDKKWIKYIRITDAEDSIIIASSNISAEWNKRYIRPAFQKNEEPAYYFDYSTGKKEKVYEVVSPVKGSKGIAGRVHLGFSQNAVDALAASSVRIVIATVLIALGFGLLLAVFFGMLLAGRVKLLSEGFNKLKGGNYNLELKAGTNKELRELVNSFNSLAKELKDKEEARAAYFGHMSGELLTEALKSKGKNAFTGERFNASVLFAEIIGFTELSSSLDPRQVVSLLNEYFSRMNEVVFRNKGMLNKNTGASLLALFGAPVPLKEHAVKAVTAALEMKKALNSLRDKWAGEGKPVFDIKISVAAGEVVLGNIGSEGQAEYSAVGGAVNSASRLNIFNNSAAGVLITVQTNELVKAYFETRQAESKKDSNSAEVLFEVVGIKKGVR